MKLPRVSASVASLIDKELMSKGGFSIDQLMELAGLSVAHTVYKVHPPVKGPRVLVLAGPGNNGGDGLVASRHLKLMGYLPRIWYPKPTKSDLFTGLQTQLANLSIPTAPENALQEEFEKADFVIDSLFGFSFHPPVRGAFVPAVDLLSTTKKPVLAVDIPSGWDVDKGPGDQSKFFPTHLISLTAPKKAADFFQGRHFVGGRFISPEFAEKFGFAVPPYNGIDQVWEETN